MQTKYLCVFIHIWIKAEVGAPWNWFKPSSKIFYWPFQGGTSFVDILCVFFLFCGMPLCASVYMCLVVTFWERADLLAHICGDCEFVTFPLVSCVRCGIWLYRFLIFAPLLTLLGECPILFKKEIKKSVEFVRLFHIGTGILRSFSL